MGTKQRKLTPRQLSVIADLFEGGLEEGAVLTKHNVSTRVYRKWLCSEHFLEELRFRIESAKRAGELIIARYTPVAAAKLVGLIDSDKAETVRRACLDILTAGSHKANSGIGNSAIHPAGTDTTGSNEIPADLPPAVASKLLEVLAEHAGDLAMS